MAPASQNIIPPIFKEGFCGWRSLTEERRGEDDRAQLELGARLHSTHTA
jgi:hypothetical protein